MTAEDSSGCTASDNVLVSLLNVEIAQGDTTICEGDSITLSIPFSCGDSVTDVDGNKYSLIKIGCQCWMKENLKTLHFANGDIIPYASGSPPTGPVLVYGNDWSNKDTYGLLYSGHAARDSRGICPLGWVVADDSMWSILTSELGDPTLVGGYLKSTSSLWNTPNVGADNSSGFSALPGGCRGNCGGGPGPAPWGGKLGEKAAFWTSSTVPVGSGTQQQYRTLDYLNSIVGQSHQDPLDNMSVRCVSDNASRTASRSVLWSTGDTTSTITVSPTTTTTYYVTVSDGITSCTDSVTVTVEPSTVNFTSCPADVMISGGPVSWTEPTADDNCYGAVTVTQTAGLPNGSIFPVGTTTVTYTATDSTGQTDSCSFTVTVDAPCATPTGLTSTPASNGAILSWLDDDPERLGVQIKGRRSGDAFFATAKTSTSSFAVGGLTSSTSYEWKLRAKCLDGDISGFSPLDTFTTLSLREGVELPELKLSPNPATTSVTVLTTDQFETMTITDLLGRVVDQRQVTDSYTEVDVKGWSAGVYLVTLEGESGKLTEQLVVE